MSVYKPWYLTKYLASAIQSANTSNNKITFKYMFGSSDSINEKDYSGLTNDLLKSIKLDDTAKISSNDVSNTDATIVAVFTNKGVTTEHAMNTIGIVAEYNGKEFLAAVCSANTPYLMPQESDNEHVEYTIRAVLGISNTGVVSVSMDPSAVATNEQLDKVRTSLKTTDDKANANQKNITDIKDPNSGVKVANAVHADEASHATNADKADYAYKNVPIEIADGTDLNNLREQGNYYCTTQKMKNSPVPNWITLVVVKNGYWNGTQTLTDTNTGETYVRVWNTGGDWFSAWEKVAVDSKIVHNSGDETISGNKKFSNKIDGSITGTATHADSASYADITPHATYADTAEHAKDIYHDADIKVASLYASAGISSDGNLKVGGSFSSKIINYEMDTDIGVHASLQRTGNLVIVHVYGELAGSAARDIGNVPLGFRPKGQIAYGFISVGGFSRIAVSPDGSFRLIDNLNGGWAIGTVTYNTADDFPY